MKGDFMENYAFESCKQLVVELKNECSRLYYQIEKNNYEHKVDENVINQYLEARKEYLYAKEQLDAMKAHIEAE